MAGRFEAYIRPGRAFAAWETNDDLTVVIVRSHRCRRSPSESMPRPVLCASALDATYSGQRSYETAMREYQEMRDSCGWTGGLADVTVRQGAKRQDPDGVSVVPQVPVRRDDGIRKLLDVVASQVVDVVAFERFHDPHHRRCVGIRRILNRPLTLEFGRRAQGIATRCDARQAPAAHRKPS